MKNQAQTQTRGGARTHAGRPAIPLNESRRAKLLQLGMSEQERGTFEAQARARGMTISNYLRTLATLDALGEVNWNSTLEV